MASTTITGLVELATSPASNDWFVVVDVSDTTQSAFGSTKKVLTSNVFLSPTITSPTLAGTVAITGDVAVNTNKFNITATTGNTAIAGTLVVSSAITASYASAMVVINATTGNPSLAFQQASTQTALIASGAADEIDFLNHLGVSMGSWIAGAVAFAGNLTINTNKFTVAGSTGNTLVAGTLDATGNFAVATNKFTVAAASGNTLVAGTLDATGSFAVATSKFTVAAATGNTLVAGTLSVTSDVAVNTNKFTIAASSGNTVVAGTLGVTSNFLVNTNKFVVTASSGDTTIGGIPKFAGSNSTGAVTANLGTVSPGSASAPYTWVRCLSADGTTCYFPIWA